MHAATTEHRDLTLMFTDIVGYSRLMGSDETLAVEMLGEYREILLSHIRAHGGIFVEFAGDAVFARFDTALTAVNAAIAIQQHLLAFNEDRDKKLPRLQTRIGLHKGEVMLRDDAIFGDTVNIAARLEPLAVPDGICISQSVYEEIRFTLSSPAKSLGNQTLKNIEHKIRAYLIKPAGIGWRDHLHYFLRGLNRKIVAYRYPLIASVLALIAAGVYFIPRWLVPGYAANYVEIADFKNLMDEKGEADYFSAGITEAVRSQLADMRDVYIVNPKEGVHAPIRLEGSVQKLGDNLRIAYRLFRRKNNVQIAGGKLDGTYQDIFILQDRLVGEIARYLADEFELQNFRPAPLKLTNDIAAYEFYLKGLDFLKRPSSHQNSDEAIKNFSTALIHDSNFFLAETGLCESYWEKYELTNAAIWLNNAEKYCLQALSKNENSSLVHKSIGVIYRAIGKYQESIEHFERAKVLDIDDVAPIVELAGVYDITGNTKRAEQLYLDALRSDPKNWKVFDGYGYFLTRNGRYDEAIETYKKALKLTPQNIFALNNLGINYFYKNKFDKAAEAFDHAASLEPSSATYANVGNMFYYAREFKKAASKFEAALKLEPDNYQMMVMLADSYKFIDGKKKLADMFFKLAIESARKEIEVNPKIAKSYQYLARSLTYFGDVEGAKKAMIVADELDVTSAESIYTHLRIAVRELNDDRTRKYAKKLLEVGYSAELLLADPDFLILREDRFSDVF